MNWLVILQLVILSDGVGALIGARGAWLMQSKGRKVEFFVVCAFALFLYSMSAFGSAYNSIVHGPRQFDYPEGFLVRAIAFRLVQSLGIWTFALAMFGGDRGLIMRVTGCLITKFQGRVSTNGQRSGEMSADYWRKEMREAVREEMDRREKEDEEV